MLMHYIGSNLCVCVWNLSLRFVDIMVHAIRPVAVTIFFSIVDFCRWGESNNTLTVKDSIINDRLSVSILFICAFGGGV